MRRLTHKVALILVRYARSMACRLAASPPAPRATAKLGQPKPQGPVDLFSAAVADMPFIDPRFVPLAGPTDAVGILVFLVSAALIIALMEVARCAIRARIRPAPCGNDRTGVVFGLEEGQTWASWHGCDRPPYRSAPTPRSPK